MAVITVGLPALIVMLELVRSAIGASFHLSGPPAERIHFDGNALTAQNIGHPARPEVPHIDALGTADTHPRGERLVDVAEQDIARLGLPDRGEHGLAATLEPPGDR